MANSEHNFKVHLEGSNLDLQSVCVTKTLSLIEVARGLKSILSFDEARAAQKVPGLSNRLRWCRDHHQETTGSRFLLHVHAAQLSSAVVTGPGQSIRSSVASCQRCLASATYDASR